MVMGIVAMSKKWTLFPLIRIVPANKKEHRRIKCGERIDRARQLFPLKCGVETEQWYCGSQVSGEQ